ncbi:UNVERIFIED_CONTAM: hypothetical protein FKN15_024784 [Acipenser sinensis]
MKLKPSLTATEDSSDDDKHSQCNDRKLGNKHAAKSTRKIEIGWIHNGKQVRARGGGGTRRISVSKNIDCDGLLKIGKDLFFPDGQSKKGNENQFTFEIWDFKENVLPLDMTVGAAYEKVKMGIVRFYLASLDRGAFETVVQVEDKVPEVTVCCEKSGLAQFCVPPKVSLHSESEPDTAAHLLKNFPSSPLKETSEFDCCTLTEEFVDEAGSDVSGISRDAYSAFWEAFFQNCAEGEYERVPALYPEYGKEEWEAVGRILLKGYLDQSYFPIQLSLAFAVGLVYGESEITPGILMASFLRYIAPFEKDIITSALDGSIGADDQDELLDILSRMGCHTVPSHDSMKCTILQVAHKQLIQEPKYALEVMADVTRSTLQKLLPEVSNLEALYEAKKPTVKQVLNMINAEVQNAAQNKTMNFLKQFIRSLDDGRLQKFLCFVTGEN